jgi:hypothetical protein
MAICEIEVRVWAKNWKVEIHKKQYADGNPALVIWDQQNREPWGKLSVNIPDVPLEPGLYHVKTWGENEKLIGPLLETGAFIDTGLRVPCGFCDASIWKLKGGE